MGMGGRAKLHCGLSLSPSLRYFSYRFLAFFFHVIVYSHCLFCRVLNVSMFLLYTSI